MLVYLDIICPKKGTKNLFKTIFHRKKPLVFQSGLLYYSSSGAPTGQTEAHEPQEMQVSALIS